MADKEKTKEIIEVLKKAESFIATTVDKDENVSVRMYGTGDEIIALTCTLLDAMCKKMEMSYFEMLMMFGQLLLDDDKKEEDKE